MALLFPVAAAADTTAADLRVDGKVLRDMSNGEKFMPRGVNWPSFEYACVQGWGYSNMEATPETVQAMLDRNINTVRIPLNQDCWLGDDGQPVSAFPDPDLTVPGYQAAVEDFVNELIDEGMAVVLDLHWTGRPGSVADGLRPMRDQRSDDFWTSVATRFRDNPSLMFDLFNEPHSHWNPAIEDWDFVLSWNCRVAGGCTAPDQPDTDPVINGTTYSTMGLEQLLAAVRKTGATQPVILSGLDYANDLSGWLQFRPADGQLVAGFHNYPENSAADKPAEKRRSPKSRARFP
mgnify:CR=1 FL=1